MTPADLLAKIDGGAPPGILDVRMPWEFARGHVPGATNIPILRLLTGLSEVPGPREAPLVLYCEMGPRAWMAGTALKVRGFTRVEYLDGHMWRWRRSRLRQAT